MRKQTILILSIFLTSTSLYAQSFSWYEYKNSQLENDRSFSVSDKDADTKKYIKKRYGIYTTKKSINDIVDEKSKNTLYAGLEYSFHPEYQLEKLSSPTNELGEVVQILIVEKKTMDGVSLKLEGDLDLSPIGLNADSLVAKVALSANYIDMDMNYRIIGDRGSKVRFDTGIGVRAATQKSDVFEKDFYGYAAGAASISMDGYKISGGGRYLFTNPEIYGDSSGRMSPFISGSLSF